MRPSGVPQKIQSISRRFSYALVSIVTVFLFAFAAIAILLNMTRIDDDLEARLDSALKLAQISLPTPLWNLDNNVVEDFIGAQFLDEDMVYAKVLWGDQIVNERKSPRFSEQNFSSPEKFSHFINRSSEILYEGSKVGTVQIVFSRDRVKKQLLLQIYGIIALTVIIIVAVSLTSITITRKYISRPLWKLQESASLIARGDLDSSIDTGSSDEIGSLANSLNARR
jgi:methyl-accepting chemotaxis protein